MWESRRDFQRVWEGWEAGFMAFHAFHTPSFPWPVLPGDQINQRRHVAQYTLTATTAYPDRLSMSASAILHSLRIVAGDNGVSQDLRQRGLGARLKVYRFVSHLYYGCLCVVNKVASCSYLHSRDDLHDSSHSQDRRSS